MKPKIRYVEWGLANNFGSYIEIHKDLRKFPSLYGPILAHELDHTSKTFTFKDFKMDMFPSINLNRFELYRFMLTRPKTWIQFLPFYWQKKKGFVIDINKTIIYIIISSFVLLDLILIKTLGGKT